MKIWTAVIIVSAVGSIVFLCVSLATLPTPSERRINANAYDLRISHPDWEESRIWAEARLMNRNRGR